MESSAPLATDYTLFIRAPQERVWQALIDPADTPAYFFQTTVESIWQVGSPVIYRGPDGLPGVDGVLQAIDSPDRLQMTWRSLHDPAGRDDPPSLVTWDLSPVGPAVTQVTVTHNGFLTRTATYETVSTGGWA